MIGQTAPGLYRSLRPLVARRVCCASTRRWVVGRGGDRGVRVGDRAGYLEGRGGRLGDHGGRHWSAQGSCGILEEDASRRLARAGGCRDFSVDCGQCLTERGLLGVRASRSRAALGTQRDRHGRVQRKHWTGGMMNHGGLTSPPLCQQTRSAHSGAVVGQFVAPFPNASFTQWCARKDQIDDVPHADGSLLPGQEGAQVNPRTILPAPTSNEFDKDDHNVVRLLVDGKEAFPTILQAIEEAKTEVLVEMYWFESDKIGYQFADALRRASQRGVSVVVVYDAFGCISASRKMYQGMQAAGCEVLEYNPIWARFTLLPYILSRSLKDSVTIALNRINRRNHRKVIVVDRKTAFTGGMNIADHWLAKEYGGDGWRDYTVEVKGPAAVLFADSITRILPNLRDAHDDRGPDPQKENRFMNLPRTRTRLRRVFDDSRSGIRNLLRRRWTVEEAWCSILHHQYSHGVQVVTNDAWNDPTSIRSGYLRAIKSAKSRIIIVNSYFVPDRRIRKALYKARERGVDVTIMVPGKSDVYAIQYATRSLYDRFVRRKINIYEFNPSVLHAKLAVIDNVCTVGTYNLDYRSWKLNLEIVAVIHCSKFADQVSARVLQDCEENSTQILLPEWRRRGALDRLQESFFHLFRRLL